MSKLYGDDEELTGADASVVKGMIARGDKNETIAAYFGVNQRAVSYIRSGKTFQDVTEASSDRLPPPGPYGVDPIYVRFYQTMTKVNQLWEQRRMAEAKELLEKALRNPVFAHELDDGEQLLCAIIRDELGIANV
jgi:hypothetical protein